MSQPSLPPGYPPSVATGYPPPVGPGYPAPGYLPGGYRPPVVGLARPVAVEAVPGTPFAVAVVGVAPSPSGPAIGSLVAGVGSVLVSFVVVCFGVTGSKGGWGPLVAGAFAVLAACAGVAALGLGLAGTRQVRRSGGAVRGRGLAVSGTVTGAAGLVLTALALLLAVLLVQAT